MLDYGCLAAGELMVSIDICMPVWKAPLAIDVVRSIASLLKMKEFDVNLIIAHGFQTAEARNNLVEQSKADYLFFQDSDVVVTPEDLLKLYNHQKDIVSGIYFGKAMPYNPIIYKAIPQTSGYAFVQNVEKGLIEIDGCGFGCCLVKKEVFKEIRTPYFEFNTIGNCSTEDFDFCRKAKRLGFKIWADWDIQLKHIGDYGFSITDWRRMKNSQDNIKAGIVCRP